MPLIELECPHHLKSDKRLHSGISQLSQEFDQGLRADGDLASVLLGGPLRVPFEPSRKPLRIPFRQLTRLHHRKKFLNGHNRPPERTRLTPLRRVDSLIAQFHKSILEYPSRARNMGNGPYHRPIGPPVSGYHALYCVNEEFASTM